MGNPLLASVSKEFAKTEDSMTYSLLSSNTHVSSSSEFFMHRWIVNESDAERFSLPMRTLDVDSFASIQSEHKKETTNGHDQITRWGED